MPANRRWREAIEKLNDCFLLRDCPEQARIEFADQLKLFSDDRAPGCLRYEIGKCLAPCVGACTSDEYGRHVRAASAFLKGQDLSMLNQLELGMRAAAGERQFERAALWRDTWESLVWIAQHLARLDEVRRGYSFVYALPGEKRRLLWYLVHRGHVAGVVSAPRNKHSARVAAGAINQTYSSGGSRSHHEPREDLDVVLLVAGWFKQNPEERERTILPDEALRLCEARLGK